MNSTVNSILAAIVAIAAAAHAQPVINSLNSDTLPRSGRIVLSGSGFGSSGQNSRVEIDGLAAWFTTWTDTRVVAYVPEQADAGPTTVNIIVGGQTSNALPLDVTLRQSDGRVKWTFEADTNDLWYRPALAPDGTIYLHASGGFVYALSPDGGLKWTAHALWFPNVPTTSGPDGTLYCSSIGTVFAISPQGQTLWSWNAGATIQNAITVGPDAQLYGACNSAPGAFSLTTAGDFRWNNVGTPLMQDVGSPGNDTIFGPSSLNGPIDQMYVGMNRDGDHHLYALDLDGHQKWAAPVGPYTAAEPVIGADGTVYTPDFIAAGYGWVIHALEPDDGSTRWIFDGDFVSSVTDLAIAPDDTLFWAADLAYLESYDPHARAYNWSFFTGNVLFRPAITPDGSTLVVGGVRTYGDLGFIRGYDAADGDLLWNIDLPGDPYPRVRYTPAHYPRITPDGRSAYVSTVALGGSGRDDPQTYLYAIDLTDGCAADFNDDGQVNTLDVLAFLNAWSAGDPDADFNADGAINTLDVLAFLNAWSAGC